MNERLPFLRDKAGRLPLRPGVYQMRGFDGKILYIGKAKALKNRVSSYFQNIFKHNEKTFKLVENINDFDFIITDSELDALILEARLIKQYQPKYNILLKDDKGLNYFKITADKYPRIVHSFDNNDKTASYIGPFASSFTVKQTAEEANRIFMLPTCSRIFPRDFGKERPCLNFYIKKCMGVCLGNICAEEYLSQINAAVEYIKAGSRKSIEELTADMENSSENLQFERAARIRDQIKAIKRSETLQRIESSKTIGYDVVGFAQSSALASVAIIKYRDGRIIDKENYFLGDEYEPEQMRYEFLLEYYDRSDEMPREVCIDYELSDRELLEEYFKSKFKKKISILTPKRGEGLAQITLAQSNAAEYLAVKSGRTAKEMAALEKLAQVLGLSKMPLHIESYDISNLGESFKVGGMIVYKNGKPFKAGYRKFTVKDVAGQDDYASMSEMVRRRFMRFLNGDGSFSKKPDLIFLDGGKGHVRAIKAVLGELGILDIPVYGLVKDERHHTRALTGDGGELRIGLDRQVFALLTAIQDEVHRFSIQFQRGTHKKKTYELQLTKVKGIGERKAISLIKHFKTKQKLKEATAGELMDIAKISMEKAEELFLFIKENL
ncbi:MAG: excinuclease ABC subunit UvrC [Eubacterium sp.]|jgi:excinuclease ABC subunit C|nr:excinuclease ABC subunit UvrC [Eubacterium sp.]